MNTIMSVYFMLYFGVMSAYESIASIKMIVALRIASEILGAFRHIPVCFMVKVILDICIREPLNMAMYSGMIRK